MIVDVFDLENDSGELAQFFLECNEKEQNYVYRVDCFLAVFNQPVSAEEAEKEFKEYCGDEEEDEGND